MKWSWAEFILAEDGCGMRGTIKVTRPYVWNVAKKKVDMLLVFKREKFCAIINVVLLIRFSDSHDGNFCQAWTANLWTFSKWNKILCEGLDSYIRVKEDKFYSIKLHSWKPLKVSNYKIWVTNLIVLIVIKWLLPTTIKLWHKMLTARNLRNKIST